jgi:hypothetical protein
LDHVLDSVDGKWRDGHNNAERVISAALADSQKSLPLVLWFHGGLVDADAGRKIAQNVNGFYQAVPGAAYPVFFVWESGIKHSLKDALLAVAQRALAKGLEDVLGKYVGARFPGGEAPLGLDESKTATSTDAIPPAHQKLLEEAFRRNEFFVAEADRFDNKKSLAAAAVADETTPAAEELDALIEAEITKELPAGREGRLGLDPGIAMSALVSFGIRVAFAVVKRYASGRDHGLKETVVEEIARSLVLPGEVWQQIKNDARAAFGGAGRVGSDFIDALKRAEGSFLDRPIYLVGHSTGAIYIAHFLDEVKQKGLALKFDLRLLAPASRCDLTGPNLVENHSNVRSCRVFGLTSEKEAGELLLADLVKQLGFVYRGSLLMMVSGALEPEPDVPLVGMRRFMTREVDRLTQNEIDTIEACVEQIKLSGGEHSLVWSPGMDPLSGTNLSCETHGAFDEVGLGVVAALLR